MSMSKMPKVGLRDSLAAVVQHLTLSEVGRLESTCSALKLRLVDWVWLREYLQMEGGWDDACRAAAEGGRLQALRWARALGCPWDEQVPPPPRRLPARCSGRQLNPSKPSRVNATPPPVPG